MLSLGCGKMNSAVVMRADPQRVRTLSHMACRDNLRPGGARAVVPDFFSADGAAPSSGAGMMKQILLRIAAVLTEIVFGEFPQPRGFQFAHAIEILLAQHPLDPDINRKRAQPPVSEKHHTIRNLRTDARQLA